MARTQRSRAVYPGTFDPVTKGHMSLIERACQIFDTVIVGVARDGGKSPIFTFDERVKLMEKSVARLDCSDRIEVVGFTGLTAEFVRKVKAKIILRGLRAVSDFEYEFQMALMNRKLAREVETVFLMPSLSWVYLSSSMVKDVARNGGDFSTLVPVPVRQAMKKKFKIEKKK